MPGRTCVRPGPPGITRGFPRLSPCGGQVGHVLLSRSPLASSRGKVPFDLHVLGAPPAFILSRQDRTLRPRAPRGLRAGGPSGRHVRRSDSIPIGRCPGRRGLTQLSPCTGSSASLNILGDGSRHLLLRARTDLRCASRYPVPKVRAVAAPRRAARRYIARKHSVCKRRLRRSHFHHIYVALEPIYRMFRLYRTYILISISTR